MKALVQLTERQLLVLAAHLGWSERELKTLSLRRLAMHVLNLGNHHG